MRFIGLFLVVGSVAFLMFMVFRRAFTFKRLVLVAGAGLLMGFGFWLLDGRVDGLVGGPTLFPLMYWANSKGNEVSG